MRINNEQGSKSRNTSNIGNKDKERQVTTRIVPPSSSSSFVDDTSTTTTSRTVSKRERIRKAMIQFAKHEFTKSKHTQTIEKVAPISPTPLKLLHHVMPHLHLNINSRIIELGCGDARWLLYLCQKYECRGIGVDIDQERLALARCNVSQLEENSRILIKERDIFDFFHSMTLNEKDDVLIMYLFREAMIRIASMLNEKGCKCAFDVNDNNSNKKEDGESRLHDDTFENIQIVCIGFTLPGFKAIWSSQVEGIRCYIYHCRK